MLAAFGERVRALREAAGWSPEDLAAKAGRSRQSVVAWQTGANWCPPPVAYRLCRELQITSDFLYFGETSGLTFERLQWLREKNVIPKR